MQTEKIDRLIKEYSDLFNNYDFYVSKTVPDDAYKAIDIGSDTYIVFKQTDIREAINEKMRKYIDEQNEKIRKGEIAFEDIE